MRSCGFSNFRTFGGARRERRGGAREADRGTDGEGMSSPGTARPPGRSPPPLLLPPLLLAPRLLRRSSRMVPQDSQASVVDHPALTRKLSARSIVLEGRGGWLMFHNSIRRSWPTSPWCGHRDLSATYR